MTNNARGLLLVLCFGLMFTMAGCSDGSPQPEQPVASPEPTTQEAAPAETQAPGDPEPSNLDMTTAAQQANDFAQRFFAQVSSENNGNLFFSPLSIHTALSMTYGGARGETARQMAEVLAFNLPPGEGAEHAAYRQLLEALNDAPQTTFDTVQDGQRTTVERPVYDLVVANRLWGQQDLGWDPGYIELTQTEYLAGVEQVDFSSNAEGARQAINQWVEETTRDRIKNLVPAGAIDALTRLVLANAIYFKANWADEFSESGTQEAPFHLADGSSVDVATMHQSETFGYAETADWQALALPYERNALSMLVVLPADQEGALETTQAQLASGELLAALESMNRTRVQVWLPKFSITQELNLGGSLQAMGMPLAFSDRADFSGMTPEAELSISSALHKAFIEVDEKGTEAAAATAIVMSLTSMPIEQEPPKVFRADRPFLFLIRHNASGAILFAGRVMDPS